MSNDAETVFEAATRHRPLLIVMSAPSGAGKTTLCRRWLETAPSLTASVSCTTRAPRPGEADGVAYHFLTEAVFKARLVRNEFLEHAIVHGNRYGTLRATVTDAMERGLDILLTIDVQGAESLRRQALAPDAHPLIRNGYTDLFVVPPSFAVLRERLVGRGTDAPEVVEKRLRNAVGEMACWRQYRYVVVNDVLDEAVARLEAIRQAEHARVSGS